MKALILWLYHRRLINFLLLVIYFLVVVLPHEQVGLLTVDIFGHLSRDTYNLIIIIAGTLGLIFFLVPFLQRLKTHPERKLIGGYLLLTIGLIVLTINTLFVINIEIVHFLQYAVMALLLFPLTLHFGETLYWATLLGAIDEGYQYFYLAPERTDYYDFNDVVTNLLGAALMLVFLRLYDFSELMTTIKKDWYRSVSFWSIIGLGIIGLGLYASGVVGFYPVAEGMVAPNYLLVRVVPSGYWSVVHPNVTYHVMQPLEGLIITGILLLIYKIGLDTPRPSI